MASEPQQRRTEILAAAARLFRRRGFAQVGIDDIGAEVGLSGPALYRYFDSKQTLLAEIIIGHLDRIDSRVDAEPVPALVAAAVEEPDAMYVMARYPGVLAGDPLVQVRERRARFESAWDSLLLPFDEGSTDQLRRQAIAGLLTHLALARSGSRAQRATVARQCIDDLLSIRLQPARAQPEGQSPLRHVNRREAILAVAIPLFCERGYAAVSLADIGTPLGVTGSAVARQFGSKEDLLATALLRGSEQISAGIALALRRSASADEAAREMLAGYVSLAVDFPELVVVQNIEPYALSERYRSERRKRHRGYVDELAHVVELADPRNGKTASRLRAGAAFGALNEAIVGAVRARSAVDAADLLRIASAVALP
ncbi:TetR/AcrR family transcriptional regulator [Cryptosporangium sp. NPDC051539]|uniref:TetR/AcrR family transcriptional regulator n=1 Tax=Cryptosporangium sp. NPDC051539 TaxID=3363962 RepID=UPI00379DC0E1